MNEAVGVLIDEDIIREARNGNLIASGFDAANVKQTCYELRFGNIYYDLSGGTDRIALGTDGFALLKPHQLVVLITKEQLAMPPDVVGRILMKGRMFSLGLMPINTYADPGFSGNLGIVVFNSSPNYIRIDQSSPIAKIEFQRLTRPVSRPYSGQHGYQTEIWPIPTHLILKASQLQGDDRVGSPGEELGRAFGEPIKNLIDRVFMYERRLMQAFISYMLLSLLIVVAFVAPENRMSTTLALILGLTTNIASWFLIFVATSLRTRRRS